MNKALIVAKHEFLNTVVSKGFILVCIVFPLLIAVPTLLFTGSIRSMVTETSDSIGFVDQTNSLQESKGFIKFSQEEQAKETLLQNEIKFFFVVSSDYYDTGKVFFYSKGGPFSSVSTESVKEFIIENLLRKSNLDERVKERIRNPMDEEEFQLDRRGEVEKRKSGISSFFPYLLAVVLIMGMLTPSGYMVQGIAAEKENKSVEILVSSISSNQLLTGKILGLGSAAMLQVTIWLVLGTAFTFLTPLGPVLQQMELPGLLWMVVPYFILGCLLFAASMACVGTFAGSVREAQQSVQVFSLLAVLPLIFLSSISQSPNSIVARVLTYIPYTSPVTTMMRLSLTEVPLYEIIVSIILLLISVIVMIRLSARIFRIEILMYGKKANLRNILKYLRG